MRWPLKIAVAVLLVVLAGLISWQLMSVREPVYQGKPLSFWLQLHDEPRSAEDLNLFETAIQQIGTNAIPTLLQMLRAKDSSLKLLLEEIVRQQPFIQIEFTPAQELNHRAMCAFEVLGPRAKSAVPAIIQTVNKNISRTSRLKAIDVLGFIGPSAQEAVPSLLQCATNADGDVRCYAIFALGKIHSDPTQVVPVLTNALNDSYRPARPYALIALQDFGPEAKLAVPVLVEYVKTDSTTHASSALKAIDPEAAAKAGVK